MNWGISWSLILLIFVENFFANASVQYSFRGVGHLRLKLPTDTELAFDLTPTECPAETDESVKSETQLIVSARNGKGCMFHLLVNSAGAVTGVNTKKGWSEAAYKPSAGQMIRYKHELLTVLDRIYVVPGCTLPVTVDNHFVDVTIIDHTNCKFLFNGGHDDLEILPPLCDPKTTEPEDVKKEKLFPGWLTSLLVGLSMLTSACLGFIAVVLYRYFRGRHKVTHNVEGWEYRSINTECTVADSYNDTLAFIPNLIDEPKKSKSKRSKSKKKKKEKPVKRSESDGQK